MHPRYHWCSKFELDLLKLLHLNHCHLGLTWRQVGTPAAARNVDSRLEALVIGGSSGSSDEGTLGDAGTNDKFGIKNAAKAGGEE